MPDRRDGSRAYQHKLARLPVGKIDRRETVVLDARIISTRCFSHEFRAGGAAMTERSTTCWHLLHGANVAVSISHRRAKP